MHFIPLTVCKKESEEGRWGERREDKRAKKEGKVDEGKVRWRKGGGGTGRGNDQGNKVGEAERWQRGRKEGRGGRLD